MTWPVNPWLKLRSIIRLNLGSEDCCNVCKSFYLSVVFWRITFDLFVAGNSVTWIGIVAIDVKKITRDGCWPATFCLYRGTHAFSVFCRFINFIYFCCCSVCYYFSFFFLYLFRYSILWMQLSKGFSINWNVHDCMLIQAVTPDCVKYPPPLKLCYISLFQFCVSCPVSTLPSFVMERVYKVGIIKNTAVDTYKWLI